MISHDNPARADFGSHTSSRTPTIHVPALGGAQQLAHFIPVACELERRAPGSVTVFVPSSADAAAVRGLAARANLPVPTIEVMDLPGLIENRIPAKLDKLVRLLAFAGDLRAADLILCAERTSTLLRRIWPGCPPIVHIPHGTGDRAKGFEKRFAHFAHVLVAGEKDRERLVASGRIAASDCTVCGPVKLANVLGSCRPTPLGLDPARPTLLYNPHFCEVLGSFEAMARTLIDAVLRDGRYNLVVAPHMRLARDWSEERRAQWETLAVPGQVIVDLGSPQSCDMTYTRQADLYIGDVSSQVYEFLVKPRPCLFINAHDADWQASEDYAMWHFGEVITPDAGNGEALIGAIDRAFTSHRAYRRWQQERMRHALDGLDWAGDGTPLITGTPPHMRAADTIERLARRSQGTPATAPGRLRAART